MDERYQIDRMRLRGDTQADIARVLGRSPGTISRELRRYRVPPTPNGVGGMTGYIAGEAQRQADRRRAAANVVRLKLGDSPLSDYVKMGLSRFWSPQQIAARLELDHPDNPSMRISAEAIYQWVYRKAHQGEPWHRQLRRRRKRRRRRIPLRNQAEPRFRRSRPIDQHPAVVDDRSRVGDWESDTVCGAMRSRVVLATHVERKTRFVLIRKLPDGRATTFNRHSVRAFADISPWHRLTLTADNGSEFARFARLEKKLGVTVYFAQPYKAWQRGANENTNGLIRQFFPKGIDLSKVKPREVAHVQDLLNNRPRKCLNYRTPTEVFLPPPTVALRS